MKMMTTWIQRLAVGTVVVALAASALAQDGKERIAKVTRIKGSARYYTAESTAPQTLKVGQKLKAGTTIQTADKSVVDLVLGEEEAYAPRATLGEFLYYQPLAEQDTIRIYADSVLALDKLTLARTGADEVTETQLDLKAGKIFGKARKLSAASKYEIKIPNGVAGIRGTVYSISSDGVLTVLVGSVVIAYVGPDGNVVTQVINAGYRFDARTGQLTPIPDIERKELELAAREAGRGLNPAPVTYPTDETFKYISPTVGTTGSGS